MTQELPLNPWIPMCDPVDVAHLGKLGEELNEAGAAVQRCQIQGIEESEPVTHKPNRQWLEEELGDVLCNIELVIFHFRLDRSRILERREQKTKHLRRWHGMLRAIGASA